MINESNENPKFVDNQFLFDSVFAFKKTAGAILDVLSVGSVAQPSQLEGCQIDPMDAILILKARLLNCLNDKHVAGSRRKIVSECFDELQPCELLLLNTVDGSKLSKEALTQINSFVAKAEAVLGEKFTNEDTWGGKLPAELFPQGLLGSVDVCGTEEGSTINPSCVFKVRSETYLKDGKKVGSTG
jgi:hypothetical protein